MIIHIILNRIPTLLYKMLYHKSIKIHDLYFSYNVFVTHYITFQCVSAKYYVPCSDIIVSHNDHSN